MPARHVSVHDLGRTQDRRRRRRVAAHEQPERRRDLRVELESLGPRADGHGIGDVLPLGRLVHLGQGAEDPEMSIIPNKVIKVDTGYTLNVALCPLCLLYMQIYLINNINNRPKITLNGQLEL